MRVRATKGRREGGRAGRERKRRTQRRRRSGFDNGAGYRFRHSRRDTATTNNTKSVYHLRVPPLRPAAAGVSPVQNSKPLCELVERRERERPVSSCSDRRVLQAVAVHGMRELGRDLFQ